MERIATDARHTIANYYTCQAAAVVERTPLDTRHTVRNGHTRKSAATIERITPDNRHTVRDGHACQPTAAKERITPDTRHVGSNFNCLRFFYPSRSIIQAGIDYRLLIYFSRPIVFFDASICERYLSLGVTSWFKMRNNPLFDVLWWFT